MRHMISILVVKGAGALSSVAGLFSARGYNSESLTVAPTEDPSLSRMTLVTRGSDSVVEQITKQLNKLVEVVKLVDLTEGRHIERELLLVKVEATTETRAQIRDLAEIFHGRIVDVGQTTCTVELTGMGDKLDAFLQTLRTTTIVEVVRSGLSGIARGRKALRS